MTTPFEALERSLRAGSPDESGYRAQPFDLSTATVDRRPTGTPAWAPTRVVPVTRMVRARRMDSEWVAVSWRGLAAAIVVAFVLVAVGIVGVATRTELAGPLSSETTLPKLTERFSSTRHGFSIAYPAGWSVVPATAGWRPNTILPIGNPALDRLERSGVARLDVASQPLGVGQTEDDWLAAFFHPFPRANPCPSDPSRWPRLQLNGASAHLTLIDCPTSQDAQIAAHDLSFEALAFNGGRVYQVRLNGDVNRADFEALLKTIRFDPVHAVD